jgi:hypothetical protein
MTIYKIFEQQSQHPHQYTVGAVENDGAERLLIVCDSETEANAALANLEPLLRPGRKKS